MADEKKIDRSFADMRPKRLAWPGPMPDPPAPKSVPLPRMADETKDAVRWSSPAKRAELTSRLLSGPPPQSTPTPEYKAPLWKAPECREMRPPVDRVAGPGDVNLRPNGKLDETAERGFLGTLVRRLLGAGR